MPYSVFGDVRSICDTDMTDAEITNVITWVDSIIDMSLDVGTLSAAFLENLSSTYAALRCMLKDPNARGLGEYSERRDVTLQMLKKEVDELFKIGSGGVSVVAKMEALK